PRQVVVDASLGLKWLVEEEHTPEAWRLLDNWRTEGTDLLAPSLFYYEIANALAKRLRRGEFTLGQTVGRIRLMAEAGPTLWSDIAIHLRAIELVHRFGFSSAYDAHYLALAEAQGCELWTADQRLWNSVKHELSWVHCIGEAVSG